MRAVDWGFPTAGRVISGSEVLSRLPGLVSEMNSQRVVMVTSRSMTRSSVFALLRGQLGDAVAAVHSTVTPHTPMDDVRALREMDADCYVAVGGSSVIDAMKAAIWLDRDRARPRGIAVPALFGGAEVTPRAGVTEGGVKQRLTDERIVPDVVLLDPRVPAAVPPEIAKASVANALAHCVEGMVSVDASPMSDACYLRAVALIRQGVNDADRLAALGAYQSASVLAALPRVRMAAAHAIAHAASPLLGVPHAIAHGVLCRVVMSYTIPARASRYVDIASALGRAASATDALNAVTELLDRLGIPRGLAEVGVPFDRLPDLADMLVGSDGQLDNPRPIPSRDDLLRLLERAWSGDPMEGTPK